MRKCTEIKEKSKSSFASLSVNKMRDIDDLCEEESL